MTIVQTYSRALFTNTNGTQRTFAFDFDTGTGTSTIDVFENGKFILPPRYQVSGNSIVFSQDDPPPGMGSTIEIVRVTKPPVAGDPTLKQLLLMIQEASDKSVFNNGHGLPLAFNAASGSSLLMNSFGDPPPDDIKLPVVQLLPDGGLVADPRSINPGGFDLAAVRSQHTIPSTIPPQSGTMWWFSGIIDAPEEGLTTDKKSSIYGFKITLKGYQPAQGPNQDIKQENCTLNVIGETAAGVTSGTSQAIIAEARHESAQATLTWPMPATETSTPG